MNRIESRLHSVLNNYGATMMHHAMEEEKQPLLLESGVVVVDDYGNEGLSETKPTHTEYSVIINYFAAK